MQAIQFGAIYRLVDQGTPVTEEARTVPAFEAFKTKENEPDARFLAQRDSYKRNFQILSGPYFLTDTDGMAAFRRWQKDVIQSALTKSEKKHKKLSQAFWADIAQDAQDLDISTLNLQA